MALFKSVTSALCSFLHYEKWEVFISWHIIYDLQRPPRRTNKMQLPLATSDFVSLQRFGSSQQKLCMLFYKKQFNINQRFFFNMNQPVTNFRQKSHIHLSVALLKVPSVYLENVPCQTKYPTVLIMLHTCYNEPLATCIIIVCRNTYRLNWQE